MENVPVQSGKRPVGVTIIAALLTIGGVIVIVDAIYYASTTRGLDLRAGVNWFLLAPAALVVVFGALHFFLAWGLWTLERWALWATIVVECIALLTSLALCAQPHFNVRVLLIYVILSIIILSYLSLDSNVRAAFRK
jgi:hypothetical protein